MMAAECATGRQQEQEKELLDRSRAACLFSSQIQDADQATKVVVRLRSRQILSASPLHQMPCATSKARQAVRAPGLLNMW